MTKSKKEQFTKRSKGNDTLVYVVVGVVAIFIVFGGIAFFGGKNNNPAPAVAPAGQTQEKIKEVNITPTVEGNNVVIKKSEVLQNKIVRFEYAPVQLTLKNGQQIAFPLMAYITPSGKLNVAIRMCEPCNGLSFSTVNGNILNCDTCGTQWDLETNQWNGVGASSCGGYPPEIIKYTENGDNIEINIDDFKNWLPRV